MVNTQYDLVLNSYLIKQSTNVSTQSCGTDYTKDIGRCNNTYGKCAIVAVIAAVDGIVPGLIVGVFCAWDLSDCREDAKEDYVDCIN